MSSEQPVLAGAALRYATALFELSLDGSVLEEVEGDLLSLKRMLEESADLRRLVRSPIFGRDEQTKAREDKKVALEARAKELEERAKADAEAAEKAAKDEESKPEPEEKPAEKTSETESK